MTKVAAAAAFGPGAEAMRRRLLAGPAVRLFLWKALPLAAFAGLRVVRLDERGCAVRLPGGWRTRNPFRSAYFAAQAMAAEMSTGAPAMVLLREQPASIAMLVVGLRATYAKKLVGPGVFTFEGVGEMRDAIASASAGAEGQGLVARSVGRDSAGDVVSEFEISWSFRRRPRA